MAQLPVLKQHQGEHIQAFMWRVEQAMEIALGREITERESVSKVLKGLDANVFFAIPNIIKPLGTMSRANLLWYGDNLSAFLPKDDPFYGTDFRPESISSPSPPPQPPPVPKVTITISNETAGFTCYKCGLEGHKANKCTRARVNSLRKQKPGHKREQRQRRQKRLQRSGKGFGRGPVWRGFALSQQ